MIDRFKRTVYFENPDDEKFTIDLYFPTTHLIDTYITYRAYLELSLMENTPKNLKVVKLGKWETPFMGM